MTFTLSIIKNDAEDNDILVRNYVSEQLLNSIADSAICHYDFDESISASESEKICLQVLGCKNHNENYICDWGRVRIESDVDYFTKSQDIYPSWKLNIKTSTLTEDESTSVIEVVLGNDPEPKNTLNVSLNKINAGWKIISVTEDEGE